MKMKTAMKKLFSLVLVAVLLVGVMPFQASAAEIINVPVDIYVNGSYIRRAELPVSEDITLDEDLALSMLQNRNNRSLDTWVSSTGKEFDSALLEYAWLADQDAYSLEMYLIDTTCAHSWNEATCTAPKTCATCGETEGNALGHTPGEAATCTTAQICTVCNTELNAALGHTMENGVCAVCSFCDTCQTAPCSCPNNMCPFCFLDKGECVKCETHEICVMNTEHAEVCSDNAVVEDHKGQVKVYLNLNYGDAYEYGEEMEYVWAEKDALLKDVIATIPAPTRDRHHFQHWTTDVTGRNIIDQYNNEARATADGVMIYAQWVDIVQSTKGKVDLTIHPNFGDGVQVMENIVAGTKMSDILEYVSNPVRLNYKFVGWYWDADCDNAVNGDDRIYQDDDVYAKWEYRNTNNEIMLKIYLNDNTKSVAKIVDMYSYSTDDDAISLGEVKTVVKKYYTSRDSDGMHFEGLFDTDGWSKYVRNSSSIDGYKYIDVNEEDDTVVYVMVQNAKVRTSSSSTSSASADSSNPKTGDMIMTPAIVLCASVGALATLFYLNKKRSI